MTGQNFVRRYLYRRDGEGPAPASRSTILAFGSDDDHARRSATVLRERLGHESDSTTLHAGHRARTTGDATFLRKSRERGDAREATKAAID